MQRDNHSKTEGSPLLHGSQQDYYGDWSNVQEQNAVDRAVSTLHNLITETSHLIDLAECIGKKQDSAQLRQELKSSRETAGQLLSTIAQLLRQPPPLHLKQKHARLARQTQEAVQEFKRAARNSIVAESLDPLSASRYATHPNSKPSSVENNSYKVEEQQQQIKFTDSLQDRGLSVDKAIILETNCEYKTLEKDLQELAIVFKEVKDLVGDQGEDLRDVEQITQIVVDTTEHAVKNLRDAEEYQTSARKKFILIGFLSCVVICIVLVLVVVVIVVVTLIETINKGHF